MGALFSVVGSVFGGRDDVDDVLVTRDYVTISDVNLPGLGFNIARYNASACSWNTFQYISMVESPNIIPQRQIEGFWQDPTSPDPASSIFTLFSNSPM